MSGRRQRSSRTQRRGLSLLELLVVVTLLGVFSSVVLIRYGRDIFGDVGAKAETQILAQGILHAQRAAIRTGDKHGVIILGSTGSVTGWNVVRRFPDGTDVLVDGPHQIAEDVSVTTNSNEMWFDFEGAGTNLFTARLTGPNRVFQLEIEPFSRMIQKRDTRR
ncbi:MAG: GspH/FimT family pseudopilin [Planctomycetota bacterium]